jgi:hypothetical protein
MASGRRTGGARALVVVGCVVLVLANLAVWLNRVVVSSDGWVATVGPLSQEEAVAAALSQALIDRVEDDVDLQELASERLPEQAQPLAAPLGSAIRSFVEQELAAVLRSDHFHELWVAANRRAHDQFLALLEGEAPAGERGRQVVLRLGDAIETVDSRLEARGLDLFDDGAPRRLGDLELFHEERLERARTAYDVFDALDWVFPLVALILFAAAVTLSARRRRTAIEIGLGVALAMALTMIGARVGRRSVLGDIDDERVRAAADSIWDQARAGLVQQTVTLLAAGLLVAVGSWVTGPAPMAVRFRARGRRELAGLRRRQFDTVRAGTTSALLARRRRVIEGAALVVAIVVLLVAPRVTAVGLLVAALSLGAFVVLVELVAGAAPAGPARPDASPPP